MISSWRISFHHSTHILNVFWIIRDTICIRRCFVKTWAQVLSDNMRKAWLFPVWVMLTCVQHYEQQRDSQFSSAANRSGEKLNYNRRLIVSGFILVCIIISCWRWLVVCLLGQFCDEQDELLTVHRRCSGCLCGSHNNEPRWIGTTFDRPRHWTAAERNRSMYTVALILN